MISHRVTERAHPLSKPGLRALMKATLAALDPADRRAQEDALASRYANLPGFADANSVLLFVAALPDEPRTAELFDLAYEARKTVLCPRVNRRAQRLSIHRIADPGSDLVPGILGIPEPKPGLPEEDLSTVDWVLVPGLAFDERGFRLGRGGGYYDRLIPLLRPDATCWSICFECQLVPELPVEAHDAPLDGISTPARDVHGCRPNERFRRLPSPTAHKL
jgi:5-formyltetrahydrofolate cyclo-ligase